MAVNGAHADGFSPLSVAGVLVHNIAEENGFPISQGGLFVASFAVNFILSVLTIVVFALLGRLREGGSGQLVDLDIAKTARPHGQQILTLVLIRTMLVCTLGFHMPIGFVALSAGLLLALINIKEHQTFIGGISWSTVLLVAGMVTYVSLLQHVGVIPLAGPLLATSSLSASGTVAALAIAATVVDVSPFSTDGALVVANAPEAGRQRVYRQLMFYAGAIVLAAPVLAWALLVPAGIM